MLADQGDITMVGHTVDQDGVLLSTTSVDVRGTVHLLTDTHDSTASVVLAPGSVTEILPEDDGQTANDSQRAADLAASIADNQGAAQSHRCGAERLQHACRPAGREPHRNIHRRHRGGAGWRRGAGARWPGGGECGQSITVQSGATIDVSGTNAVLPASANTLLISGVVPYELRDSAANRSGGIDFATVAVDERTLVEIASGAYAGNIYTAGGLLEVSGNLGLVPHGIQEWSSIGGQVILQAASNVGGTLVGGTVTVASGATINLTGGTVTYDAGLMPQSYVQAADGQIYNVNDAPGDLVYDGVYTGDAATHPRWHITQTFDNPAADTGGDLRARLYHWPRRRAV